VPAMPVKIAFIFWQAHLQAFFMGLLFFLAGFFALRSLERRGPAGFLRERARRLGLPSVLFMLLIQPFMLYVLLGHPHVPDRPALAVLYGHYIASGRVFSGSGPMWFALALLFFCAGLAGLRAWKPAQTAATREGGEVRDAKEFPSLPSQPSREIGGSGGLASRVVAPSSSGAPGAAALMLFGAGLALSTFLVRLAQPFGTDVLNFQLCFFAQYLAAFAVGVAAGKHRWLEPLAESRRARVAGWLGLIGGPAVLGCIAWLGGLPPESGTNPYTGGWNLRAFSLATWEQLAGLGLALGLLAWCQRRCNSAGPVAQWFSERAFAVYMLHAPVLVALTPLLRPVACNPFVSAALLTATGLIASFLAADLAKRLPGLRKIL